MSLWRQIPLLGTTLALFLIAGLASKVYINEMYGGAITSESLIEGTNYAVQTVTTVGYGNWEVPAMRQGNSIGDDDRRRVLRLRGASVGFMLLGGTVYVVLTGVIVALIVQWQQAKA